MLKRVLPLCLALVVAGAPVALAACHVACISTMAHGAMAHAAHDHGHSCHDVTEQRPQFSAVPHACGHGGDLPSAPTLSAAQDPSAAAPLALVVTSAANAAPLPIAAFFTSAPAHSLHTAALPSAVPLRI
jgi:hypothetical protein